MQIQQINKSDAEKVFIVVKNVDAATITTGLGIILCNDTSCDGISVVKQPTATFSKTFVGISAKDIPVNGYGTATVWGVADSIMLSNAGTSITVTKGDVLWPSGVAGMFYSTGTDATNASTLTAAGVFAKKAYIIATSSNTVSAIAWVSGLVRAL